MSNPETPRVDQARVEEAEQIARDLDELKQYIEDDAIYRMPKRLDGVIDRAIIFMRKDTPTA